MTNFKRILCRAGLRVGTVCCAGGLVVSGIDLQKGVGFFIAGLVMFGASAYFGGDDIE
jgi:uncharacterized membrane protein YccC